MSGEPLRIGVFGDVFLTHQIFRKENSDGPTGKSHSAYQSSEYVYYTGAVLLERLLEACKLHLPLDDNSAWRSDYVIEGPLAREDRLDEVMSAIDRHVVTSYLYRNKSKESRLRMHLALGLQPTAKKDPDPRARQPRTPPTANNDLNLYDLSDLGIDHTPALQRGSKWTIIKLRNRSNRDEFSCKLTCAIRTFLQDPQAAENTIIILNVSDIRQSHLSISHQISWERTLQQLVLCISAAEDKDHYLHFLHAAKHIVISLAPDAAVYIGRGEKALMREGCSHPVDRFYTWEATSSEKSHEETGGRESAAPCTDGREDVSRQDDARKLCRLHHLGHVVMLAYEPASIEGDLGKQIDGYMRGQDSLLTASLCHHLLQSELAHRQGRDFLPPAEPDSPPAHQHPIDAISTAMVLGVKSARFLLTHGYDDGVPSKSYDPCLFEMRHQILQDENEDAKHEPLFPYDLLASILARGDIERFRSAGKQFDVLDREWADCGWIYVHRVAPDVIERIIQKAKHNWELYRDREPHYKTTFWTLRESTTGRVELKRPGGTIDFDRDLDHGRVVVDLAKQILRFGPEWLIDRKLRENRVNLLLTAMGCRSFQDWKKQEPGSPGDNAKRWLLSNYTNDPLPVFPMLKVDNLIYLDRREIEGIRILSGLISGYIDGHRQEPLNLAVFGPPGSGKSTAVKAILRSLERPDRDFKDLTYNLSQFQGVDDLRDAFSEIQDWALRNKLPVVFWDEFDTRLGTEKLGWLPYFLGPMEDGQAQIHNRTLRLPQCIFVFAGSTFSSYEKVHRYYSRYSHTVEAAPRGAKGVPASGEYPDDHSDLTEYDEKDWIGSKATDFKSRLTGVLDVFGVDPVENSNGRFSLTCDDMGFLFRRALVLRHNLKRTFGARLFTSDEKLNMDEQLMEAFLLVPRYFHGARSISRIVEASRIGSSDTYTVSCLPPSSVLRLHVSPCDFEWFYSAYPKRRDAYWKL